ncbi:MAG: hypothetical protein QXM73_03445 [Candidatus Nezhaarchaeales archaeon]
MIAGILDYSIYVPKYRVKAEDIRKAWGEFLGTGVSEKAVCYPDEDVITMAAEACMGIVKRGVVSLEDVRAVFLATTTSHYVEKELASTLTTFLGISKAYTLNLGYSIRSGTSALIAASTYVKSTSEKALVIAADTPRSSLFESMEHEAGCGAAAFVLQGKIGDAVAVIEEFAAESYEVLGDRYRVGGEERPRSMEVRAYNTKMFREITSRCIKSLLNKLDRSINAYNYIIVSPPIDGGRISMDIIRSIGGSPEKVSMPMISNIIGDCGCATPLISLAYVLDSSKPGERILLASYGYGGGCDALSISVTEKASDLQSRKLKVKDYMDSKEYIDFKTYLRYRYLAK